MVHPLPSPDILSEQQESNTTYIGLGLMVPKSLRPLCTCAGKQDAPGLFFARVLCRTETKSCRLSIAALPHYFDSDEMTYGRHVRTMTLTEAQFGLLLAYDRRLAGMATCDVRDELIEHVKQVQRKHAVPVQPQATQTSAVSPTSTTVPKQGQHGAASGQKATKRTGPARDHEADPHRRVVY